MRCQRATHELSRMTAITPSNCGEVHCETFSCEFFICSERRGSMARISCSARTVTLADPNEGERYDDCEL